MEQSEIRSLLSQVTILNRHYKKIDLLTGENFNIFRILRMEASEVRLHSAFLASLLDPDGNHGQRDIFLKLFINQFCFKGNSIDTTNCKVQLEKHTGFISEDGLEGGRIDIIISDNKGNHIIIENKIYAGDQNNQLKRYYNHSNKADLIYLTLDGKLPSEGSCIDLVNNVHFKCCSYQRDIVKWLEDCRKEVAILPSVRESLTQYITLIKYLTNQTTNNAMQEELNQLLLHNLEASFAISDNLDNSLEDLLWNVFTPKLEAACHELGLSCNNCIDFKRNYTGIWITKPEWQYVNIGFQFWSTDKEMVYGLTYNGDEHKDLDSLPTLSKEKLQVLSDQSSKHNGWWPLHYRMDEQYGNWNKYQAWKAVKDGSMLTEMVDKIKYLLKITEGLSL